MTFNAEMTYEMMTWKQATQCFIHNIKAETGNFHKTAGVFRAGFLAFATRFAPATAAVTVFDDALVWFPPVSLGVAFDNFVAVPAVLFLAFSTVRISMIRMKFNRMQRRRAMLANA